MRSYPKMKALIISLLLVFMDVSLAIAQDRHIVDSITEVIETADHDSTIAYANLVLGEELYLHNLDTSNVLWMKALEIATDNLAKDDLSTKERSRFNKFQGAAYNNIGYYGCAPGSKGDK